MDILEFLRRRRATDEMQLAQLEGGTLIPYAVRRDGTQEPLTEENKAILRQQLKELDAQIAFYEHQRAGGNTSRD